jgi:hypothetical protein
MTIPNPYNPLQPVDDPALFFGRADVFAFFRQQYVGTAHDHAVALIGRRGLGKSAVLRQLQLDDQYVPCIVSLGALDLTGEAVLIAAFAAAIRDTLDQTGASTYRLPDWPDAAHVRAWFQTEFLDVALSALRVRFLLLMLDDAHLLIEAIDRGVLSGDFMGYLGDLLAAYERFDMVMALDSAFEDRILSIDLLNDPNLHIRLSELPREDAERLVQEPVADSLRYEDGVADQILAWAGGHPFLLHSICRLLFRRSEERNHSGPITENDLNAIRDAVLDQSSEIFDPLWARASQNERITLQSMAAITRTDPHVYVDFETIYGYLVRAGYAISKTQLAAALRSLSYEGLVRAHENLYALPADLIEMWVSANVPAAPPADRERDRDAVEGTTRPAAARWTPLIGLLAVILIVGVLGAAALGGLFDSKNGDPDQPVEHGSPTATLSLNLEATRQADFLTQTERARPTETPTRTPTPTATDTPTATATPTDTPEPTSTDLPTDTPTPSPTDTPRPTPTDTPGPSPVPTDTPRPTPLPTLDPGR